MKTEKRCPRCGEVLPADAFASEYRKREHLIVLAAYCRTCYRAYWREYSRRNRARCNERARQWRARLREAIPPELRRGRGRPRKNA